MLTISRAEEIVSIGAPLTKKARIKLEKRLAWYKRQKPFHENIKRLRLILEKNVGQ
jgi:hypothetical protein